jgi:MFS family permease
VTITASESISPVGSIRRNRTFRRLLGASSVSMLGSHITTIAYPLLVLHLTGSPFTAGCAVFAATAPSILAYIPAGALVDRWSPRRAMLLSEFGRAVAIAIVALTLALGKPIVPLLMAVAVIEGVLEVFSRLAERRYLGSLVERDQISSALVHTEARNHVVLVAGRPLGGLLFGIGPIFPFLADFFSFVYSVTTLFGIKDGNPTKKANVPPCAPIPKNSLINDIRQGVQWIRKDRVACIAILSFSTGTLIFQALIMIFLGGAHSRQLPAFAIGMVLATSGVGGALGSVAASRLPPKVSNWMPIQTWIWCIGFSFFLLPLGRQVPFTAIIMAILGLTGALGNIALDTHVMQNADQEMLARVTSVGRLMSFAACSIGPIIGGILAQEFGSQRAMSYLFLFTLVPLMLSIFTPHASSRQSSSHVGQEPIPGSRDGHLGQRGARRRDGERGTEQSDPVGRDRAGTDEDERAKGHRNGAAPLRLLAGATIVALGMITKRADR